MVHTFVLNKMENENEAKPCGIFWEWKPGLIITDNQIGKSHDYPQNRKPYSTSRAGVGGRPKKMEMKAGSSKSIPLTYFDKLLKSQNQKGKNLNILVIALEYFNIDVRMSHFRKSFL